MAKRRLNVTFLRLTANSDSQKRLKRRFTTVDEAIFFTINGQTHSSLGRTFIKNRCKKPLLEKDLLVHIDFTGISGADRVDIFMPSRERMKKTKVTEEIKETIQDCIKEDDDLQTLNEIRFSKLAAKSEVDWEFVNRFVNRLVHTNPSMIKYLKTGGQVKHA